MFKLVVLTSVLAAAAASPSIGALGWGGLGWAGLATPLAAPWAGAAVTAPWAGAAVAAPWAGAAVAAPWGVAGHGGVAVAPAIGAYNYRGPLSLAPGQPANILAADGRPLDTLSVNLDRAAHLTARAVNGGHLLRKRSAPLLAPAAAWSHSARVDVLSPALPALAAPWAGALAAPGWPAARLGWGAPLAAPWGARAWGAGPVGLGHAGVLGHLG